MTLRSTLILGLLALSLAAPALAESEGVAVAKKLAVANGIILPMEREGMDRVLNAAALTYVAAAISTLLTLLYFLMRAGLLGGRRD